MSITKKEFEKEIVRVARELFEDAVNDGNRDWDSVSAYFYEELPPRVSDHSFVQFKHWHPIVMEHTENRDAYFATWKTGADLTSYAEAMAEFVKHALHEDILEAFNDLVDTWLLDVKETDEFAESV